MKKQSKILKRNFYSGDTLAVAQKLLGCFLIRRIGNKIIRAKIIETEAYQGEDDLASHASKGRTPRVELMFGEAGKAYIYMIYGMYYCLNIVTGPKNFPAAVLIRGIEIEGIEKKKTNGPGKICKIMGIDKKLNGWDVTRGKKMWIENGEKIPENKIRKGKRIGIDYAKHCKHYLWRFFIK